MGWLSKPIAANQVPCGKAEKRNSPSGTEHCRIDVEAERCRERRAAQSRAQSEGIVARVGDAAGQGPEVTGHYVAILFRDVRVGVVEAELEYAVGERQPGAPVGEVRQRKSALALPPGKVFAAGQLVGAFESFDAVSSGLADMYHSSKITWAGT